MDRALQISVVILGVFTAMFLLTYLNIKHIWFLIATVTGIMAGVFGFIILRAAQWR